MKTLLIALLVSLGFASAHQEEVVIQLGDETITETEFDERFALAARSIAARQGLPYNAQTQALFDSLRPTYLDQLATEVVILDEAEAQGVTVPDEEVQAQLEQVRQNFGSEEAFSTFLSDSGFEDEAAFETYLRDSLTVQTYLEDLGEDVTVTDEEIQTFYEENQAQINQPLEQVRPQIEQQLVQQTLNQRIAELRSASDVEVFADNLSMSMSGGMSGGAGTGGN